MAHARIYAARWLHQMEAAPLGVAGKAKRSRPADYHTWGPASAPQQGPPEDMEDAQREACASIVSLLRGITQEGACIKTLEEEYTRAHLAASDTAHRQERLVHAEREIVQIRDRLKETNQERDALRAELKALKATLVGEIATEAEICARILDLARQLEQRPISPGNKKLAAQQLKAAQAELRLYAIGTEQRKCEATRKGLSLRLAQNNAVLSVALELVDATPAEEHASQFSKTVQHGPDLSVMLAEKTEVWAVLAALTADVARIHDDFNTQYGQWGKLRGVGKDSNAWLADLQAHTASKQQAALVELCEAQSDEYAAGAQAVSEGDFYYPQILLCTQLAAFLGRLAKAEAHKAKAKAAAAAPRGMTLQQRCDVESREMCVTETAAAAGGDALQAHTTLKVSPAPIARAVRLTLDVSVFTDLMKLGIHPPKTTADLSLAIQQVEDKQTRLFELHRIAMAKVDEDTDNVDEDREE